MRDEMNGASRMTRSIAKTIPWREIRAEWMKDPAVRAEYERIGPAMDMAFALMDARHAAGLTQAEVASRMGTSQSAVARMERGVVLPSWRSIERYARAVALSV
jgi:DNA-binding XRE family transcriptional regulator